MNCTKNLILVIIVAAIGLIADEIIVMKVVLLALIFVCVQMGRKEVSIINPFFLFTIVPFSLLIHRNISNFYMLDLTPKIYFFAIMNMVAFLWAVAKTKNFNSLSNCYSLPKSKIGVHVLVMTLLGLVPALYFIFSGSVFPLASVLSVFSIPAILCAVLSKKKFLSFIAIGLYLLPMVIGTTSKTGVLTLCFLGILVFERFYVRNNRQRKIMSFFCAASVVIMISSFGFANKERGAYDAEEGLANYEMNDVTWEGEANLFLPYMYLTTPWSNMQYIMETQDTRTYGLWAAKPILSYLQIDDNFRPSYTLVPYSSFNTVAFPGYHFKDLGYWGAFLLSLLLGFYVKKIYSRFTRSNSSLDIACYVFVAQATFELFFSHHFFTQSYPFTIVIVMELYKVIFGDKNTVSINEITEK